MGWESLRVAVRAVRQYPLRTLFIGLTNAVAVLAIIVLVVVLQSLEARIRQAFAGRGADLIFLTRTPLIVRTEQLRELSRYPVLTLRDAEFLETKLTTAEAVVPTIHARVQVQFRTRSMRVNLQARSADYVRLEDIPIALGRHLTPDEDRRRRRVAVVGWRVYRELFRGQTPLGQWIWIEGRPYRVVGVVQERGTLLGEDLDATVWVPIRTWVGPRLRLSFIALKPIGARVDRLMDEVRFWIRVRRGLRPGEPDNFGLLSTEGFLEAFRRATRALSLALIGTVGLGLVVGGIVLMNILLMAVTERTQEIGIRKAVGAHPIDIARQFLWEAIVLAGLGGIAGVLCGMLVSWGVASALGLPWTFPVWAAGLGVGLTAVTGLLFGYYPARRAARLDPVQALHYEHG